MKNLISIILISMLLPMVGLSSNHPDNQNTKPRFANILESEGIDNYQIPTFLVKFAINFCDESDDILPFFKGSRSVNIAICEGNPRKYDESFKRICKSLELLSYQNFVEIIDGDSKITIKALFNDKIIRELVILIHDNDSFVAVSMNGRIDPKNIAESVKNLNKHESNSIF